jgi:hypothetical protein
MSKHQSIYDHKTLISTKHWYITWMASLPSWKGFYNRGWRIGFYLGALGVTYYFGY